MRSILIPVVLLALVVSMTTAGESPSHQRGSVTFNLAIYDMGQGKPGPNIIGGPWFDVVPTTDSAGTVTLDLSPPAVLSPQTVWITAWANSDPTQGRWYWNDNNTQHGAPSQWRNPGGGFGTSCTDWTRLSVCSGDDSTGPDLRFEIWGNPINEPGMQVLLYSQLDGPSNRSFIAGKYTTESDDYIGEIGDCWGPRTPGWSVDRVVLEGTWVTEIDPCADFTNFLARCTGTGMVQARVVLRDNIAHSGETVLFAIDGVTYPATIGDNGISSRASISISGLGAGDHTVELIDPADCFAPIVVTCQVGLLKADAEWEADDARWAAEGGQTDLQVAPVSTKLLGNYPNPFNPSTSINYALSEDGFVSLKIYNTLGEEVANLVNEYQVAGIKSAVWNGRNDAGQSVASGIYIYRLTAGNVVLSEKMLFLK
jgi:hypothetical protein